MPDAVKEAAGKLIDTILTKYELSRDMFEDSEDDFKKLTRYIVSGEMSYFPCKQYK